MIEIRKVRTPAEIRAYLNLPLQMYKNCPYFVPPLYADEKKMFRADYYQYKTCEAEHFLALRDGRPVGRITAIIQHVSNEKTGEKRLRFTHFDAPDDLEVARALFDAAEAFGREKGMEKVCGPLSFSDLEREGLLIDGFDQLSTFEEQYNYDYYARLIEACGYSKEVDWYEYYLTCPETIPDIYRKTAERMLEMNGLHVATERNKRKFIEKYKDGIFHCLDACYAPLYGTVPMTEEMKKQIVDQFMLIIRIDFVSVICDKDENVVAFGLCFPSMGEALAGTNGKLTPRNLCRLLRAVRNPKVLDLGLIAVLPEYRLRGVNAYFLYGLMKWMKEHNIEHLETNLCLEYNQAVQSQWDVFPHRIHKKRRSYIKTL